jgi:hypothetical protein
MDDVIVLALAALFLIVAFIAGHDFGLWRLRRRTRDTGSVRVGDYVYSLVPFSVEATQDQRREATDLKNQLARAADVERAAASMTNVADAHAWNPDHELARARTIIGSLRAELCKTEQALVQMENTAAEAVFMRDRYHRAAMALTARVSVLNRFMDPRPEDQVEMTGMLDAYHSADGQSRAVACSRVADWLLSYRRRLAQSHMVASLECRLEDWNPTKPQTMADVVETVAKRVRGKKPKPGEQEVE